MKACSIKITNFMGKDGFSSRMDHTMEEVGTTANKAEEVITITVVTSDKLGIGATVN